jgi:hypothetical protein
MSIGSNGETARTERKALSKEDDAKLIFGVAFSLRKLVQQLAGEENRYVSKVWYFGHHWLSLQLSSFISYRTGEYKLHYYETPTRMKFVMLTDTKTNNLRIALHQIWANLYVEYVVKNPLSPSEHQGGVGVANELFEQGLERFVVCAETVDYRMLLSDDTTGHCVGIIPKKSHFEHVSCRLVKFIKLASCISNTAVQSIALHGSRSRSSTIGPRFRT